jgi:hypothetical protein
MTSSRYVLTAYPFTANYEGREIVVAKVSEINLNRLISLISSQKLLYAKPRRDPDSTKYIIHILGDTNPLSDELRELGVELELKQMSEIPDADDIISQAAYIALRGKLYEKGYRRGASSKLYKPSQDNIVYTDKTRVLHVYKAMVTGLDKIGNDYHLFIDASRKLEFTMSIPELEEKGVIGESSFDIDWLKIAGTPVSFYIVDDLKLKKLLEEGYRDKILKHTREVLNYLANTKRIYWKLDVVNLDVEDLFEYALIPRSKRLERELHAHGLLLRYPGKNIEVVFLPKSTLTPVASLDNVKKIIPESIESIIEKLHIPPGDRYREIKDFIDKQVNEVEIEGLHVDIIREPREEPSTGLAKLRYIKLESGIMGGGEPYFSIVKWDPKDKLQQYAGRVKLLVLIIGRLDSEIKKLIEDLEKYGVEIEHRKLESLTREVDLEDMIKNAIDDLNASDKPYKGFLVIGPSEIDERSDREIRRKIEFYGISQGIFTRYLSRVDGKGKLRYKLNTVLKSFVVLVMGRLSHRLEHLELWSKNSGKRIVNTIMGIDATTIGMEKGVLRVACAVTMINLSTGEYKITPRVYPGDKGEEGTIADVLKSFAGQLSSENALIYINRAKPESIILNHLEPDIAGRILENSIVIGATKSHSYSRIFKFKYGEWEPEIVNPEPGIYIQLNKNQEFKRGDVEFSISRYLMITTFRPGSIDSTSTLKPVLLSILYKSEYTKTPRLESTIVDYTASLSALNNVSSAWSQSLPWPLHIVDRKLKRAHELAPQGEKSILLQLLQDEEVFRVL